MKALCTWLTIIDAYRRAARRTAWNDPKEHGPFNPFIRRHPQPSDIAEEAADPALEILRRKTSADTTQEKIAEDNEAHPGEPEIQSHVGGYQASAADSLPHAIHLRKGGEKNFFEKNSFRRRVHTVDIAKPEALTKSLSFTVTSQARLLFFNSWFHLLFLFVPAGFAVNYCHVNSIAIFCLNFVAIIPSAMDLSLAVDELSLRTGELLEGIISTTFR